MRSSKRHENWQGKPKPSEGKCLFVHHKSHMAWDRNLAAAAVRSQQLTSWHGHHNADGEECEDSCSYFLQHSVLRHHEGNASDLSSGDARFESLLAHQLS
jgi:hypothetical protein